MPDLSAMKDSHPINLEMAKKKPRIRRWPWIVGGVLVVLLFIAAGSFFGYNEGIRQRLAYQTNQVTEQAATQFDLGVANLDAGQYELAQARFLYVLNLDPNFPGVQDKLIAVQVALSLTQTPVAVDTPTPTIPTLTPTPDTRSQEELFNQIKADIANKQWADAINDLNLLRQLDITYKAVQADDMYYVALRNLGIDQITKNGQLEQGLYNLAIAERFGPLDYDAVSYRTWARLYLDGASFWEVDWSIVLSYFKQIYPYLPALRDGSNMTASERFRIASIKYGDQLIAAGDFCKAQENYDAALPMSNNDSTLASTAESAKQECVKSSWTPVPPATATPKPTETPLATETPTPTSSEPAAPGATATTDTTQNPP